MPAITSRQKALLADLASLQQLATSLEAVSSIEQATAEATARLDAANAAADQAKLDAAASIAATKADFDAEIDRINVQRTAKLDALGEQEATLAAATERVSGLATEERELAGRIVSLKTEQARLASILAG